MTRLWQAGFETNTTTSDQTEFGGSIWTFFSNDSTIKRSGTYSGKFTGNSYVSKPIYDPAIAAVTARTYFRIAGNPSSTGRVLTIVNPSDVDFAALRVKTDRKVELVINKTTPTVIATTANALATGDFEQYLELWCDVTNKIVSARVNGATFGSAQLSTFEGIGTPYIGEVHFGPRATLGTDVWYDDMAVNSLSGSLNNGWCGPSAGVLTDWPTADAEVTSWSAQGGGSIFAQLDEVTPDDATSYIKETAGVNGAVAAFYFSSLPQRGPIAAMTFGVRGGGTDVTSRLANFQFHDAVDATTGGISVNIDWNLNGWKTVYPILTVERALDGSPRVLNNAYLYPSAWPGLWAAGSRSRGMMVRADALARPINISTVWRTIDYAIPVTPNVVPPKAPSHQILVTSDP